MLSDRQIREYVRTHGMITPFADYEAEERPGVISYGLTSRGYDFRVSRKKFMVFCNSFGNVIVDPKNFDPRSFVEFTDVDHVMIPPNSFCLAESVEYFRIPRELVADCVGKSTLARTGLVLNVTPAEPEWEGILTVEISNTTPLPAKIYAGEGIGQMRFFRSDDPEGCERSYKDKKGRYQAQQGLTLPFVR